MDMFSCVLIYKVMLTIKTFILPPCIVSTIQKKLQKGIQFKMCPHVKEVWNNKCCSFSALLMANIVFVLLVFLGQYKMCSWETAELSWSEGISEGRLQGINGCKSNNLLLGEFLYLFIGTRVEIGNEQYYL